MSKVHSTAVIDKTAVLADDVQIGPYCFIGPGVEIGKGTKLGPHCIVHRWTKIGQNNDLVAACSVGADPQDLKYKKARTCLEIGDNNIIREYVTLNRATEEGKKTVIGSGNLFMATSHVGHNSVIGDNNVIANSAAIGGHVVIEDNAVIGGLVGIHQFCRIGRLSIIGGFSKAVQDVAPFSMCYGNPAKAYGLNKVGLDRAGITPQAQAVLKKAFKILFSDGLARPTAAKKIEEEFGQIPEIRHLLGFMKSSQRGLCGLKR